LLASHHGQAEHDGMGLTWLSFVSGRAGTCLTCILDFRDFFYATRSLDTPLKISNAAINNNKQDSSF
jgi:hypothetical protein